MKKLLLLLLLSLGFIGSAYADAVCRDGWLSESEGSGTCSWHKGVSKWTPDGSFFRCDNKYNALHRHGTAHLPDITISKYYDSLHYSTKWLILECLKFRSLAGDTNLLEVTKVLSDLNKY